jgi:hypothetical protein
LLNFPAHVTFSPYAFFRNVTPEPRTLKFEAFYMDGGRRSVANIRLPRMVLQSGEARELEIDELMKSRQDVDAIQLVFSYEGNDNDIMTGIGSIDPSGSYVFPVPPDSAGRGGPGRLSPYWLATGGFSTMYTLWNPDSVPEDYQVTIFYGDKGESYKMQVRLEPGASQMIDIGELMVTRHPDQDGRFLPLDATHGSFLVTSPQNEASDSMSLVLAGGIYNPTKATCGMTCIECPGFTSVSLIPTSFTVLVGGEHQLNFRYFDSYGNPNDITNNSTWTSPVPSVVTVQTYGQANPGRAMGVSGGNGAITALSREGYRPYVQALWVSTVVWQHFFCLHRCGKFGHSVSYALWRDIPGHGVVSYLRRRNVHDDSDG